MGLQRCVASALTLALLTVACAGSPARAAPTGPRYTVTTIVMSKAGIVHACYGIELSMPSPFCSGLPIRSLSLRGVAGVKVPTNGVLMSQTMRLVGTWDRSAPNLTQA